MKEIRKSSVIISAPELEEYEVYVIGPEEGEEYISPSFPKELDVDKFSVIRCKMKNGKSFLIGTTKGFTTRGHYLLDILEEKLNVTSSRIINRDKEMFLEMLHATGHIAYMDTNLLKEDKERPVDLTRSDVYTGYQVPNADIETALKVIRTIRDAYLGGPQGFDSDVAVLLSHAHAKIVDLVKKFQE